MNPQTTTDITQTSTSFEILSSDTLESLVYIKENLLTNTDIVSIKGKKYINKKGYRKIALRFNINTEITSEKRIEKDDEVIYDFTVRAISPLGRYTEASASCSSREREFNHENNDVRATSQTRATNRAISDLIGLGEVSLEEMKTSSNTHSIPENQGWTSQSQSGELITSKQKLYLIKLIEERYDDEHTRNDLYTRMTQLTKSEAQGVIKNFLEGGEL